MILEVSVIKVLFTIAIIIGLFAGFMIGLMRDFSETSIKIIGVLLAIFGAHYIKNPVSVFFYNHLPFFNFFGPLEGITSFNILLYEFLAFLVVFILLLILLRIIAIFTKIVDKLVNFVLAIGIPSNLMSGIVGFAVAYVLFYIMAYMGLSIASLSGNNVSDQTFMDTFVKTPVLKGTLGQPLGSMLEIANASIDYTDPKDLNYHSLEILIKNRIISIDNAKSLVESGKIDIPDSGKLIAKYQKK